MSKHSKALNQNLTQKAAVLRESQLFVNPSDGAELVEKQSIFLVLAGLKPVAEVLSGHWVRTPTGRTTVADDPREVGAFLSSLGLAYRLTKDKHVTKALVSLHPKLLDEYLQSSDSTTTGRLFGYPESAVAAFAADTSMPTKEQEKAEQDAGLDEFVIPFRLSQDNWQKELGVAKHWQEVLTAYGLR